MNATIAGRGRAGQSLLSLELFVVGGDRFAADTAALNGA